MQMAEESSIRLAVRPTMTIRKSQWRRKGLYQGKVSMESKAVEMGHQTLFSVTSQEWLGNDITTSNPTFFPQTTILPIVSSNIRLIGGLIDVIFDRRTEIVGQLPHEKL